MKIDLSRVASIDVPEDAKSSGIIKPPHTIKIQISDHGLHRAKLSEGNHISLSRLAKELGKLKLAVEKMRFRVYGWQIK